MKRSNILFLFLFLLMPGLFAARVTIIPQGKTDFKIGEKVPFLVTALDDQGKKLTKGTFTLYFHKSGGVALQKPVKIDLSKGNPVTVSASMKESGFIFVRASSCILPDKKVIKWKRQVWDYSGGAAVEPEKIRAVSPVPKDFDAFWQKTLKSFEKAKVIVSPQNTVKRKGYKVSRIRILFPDGVNSINGYLSIPEGKGKFPAVAGVPGAGPGNISPIPFWSPGIKAISLWLNVFPYPPAKTVKEQRKLYFQYNEKLKKLYFFYNAEDREKYVYRNIWAAVSRGVDFVASLPEFDGKNFAMAGNSQGGATAIAVAGLNNKISCVVASVPALSDHGGWKKGRQSGWPNLHDALKGKADAAAPYYDVSTFAAKIKVPFLGSVGYIDTTCSPSSVYSAFNNVKGPKTIYKMPRHGHRSPPAFRKMVVNFLDKNLSR